jgi:uncharacterized iron-regulated protein
MRLLTLFALQFIFLLGITGCSTHKISTVNNKQESSHSSISSISAVNLKALESLTTITPQLAKYRVVFVGEQHDQYADHLNQLAIIKSLHKHWKQNTSIGLEMIQRPYQSYLDDYIAGKISEYEMLKGVQWYERWRYDFRLYRPIFNYAKANKINLIALNIPKELTRRITKVGIKGLTSKERQQLPAVIDRSNDNYKKRISSVFGKHSRTSSKGVERFLDAQLAWDEGMAFSASKYLNKNLKKRMVILAGGGHVINRSGIPDRLDRQIKSNSAVVLNNINQVPSSKQGDFLLFSPEIKLPSTGKIGIAMSDSKKGVLVKSVAPHGAALKAGIQKGDVIIEIDGQLIKLSSDIRLWGLDKQPDDAVTLKLRRKNKVLIKKLRLKGKTIFKRPQKH